MSGFGYPTQRIVAIAERAGSRLERLAAASYFLPE
jgi:hypothetical protein